MYCKKCGTQLPEDSLFCFNCGEPVEKPVEQEISRSFNFNPEIETEAKVVEETAQISESKPEETPTIINVSSIENLPDNAAQVLYRNESEQPETTEEKTEAIDPDVTQISETVNVDTVTSEPVSEFEQKIENITNIAEQKLEVIDDKVETVMNDAVIREEVEMLTGSEANSITGNASLDDSTADTILKIVSILFGVYFAIRTVTKLFRFFSGVFTALSRFRYYGLFNLIKTVLGGLFGFVAPLLICGMFLIFAFKRKKTQTTELLFATILASLGAIVLDLLNMLIFKWAVGKDILLNGVVGLGGALLLFLVLLLAGYKTLLAMDFSTAFADSLNAVMEAFGSSDTTKEAVVAPAGQVVNAPAATAMPSGGAVVNPMPMAGAMPVMGTVTATPGTRIVSTDRSLLKYILFTLLTCGIYSFFFVHSLAKDVNEMCREDNDKVGGLFAYIVLSMLTCGLYSIYWEYKIANRLQANAPRYGIFISESGSTVLLWTLVGMLLCGLGPLFAMNIVIKNTNQLAYAYNANIMNNQPVSNNSENTVAE